MGNLFRDDYSEICHPRILKALSDAGNEQFVPYGLDSHSKNAANLIKDLFKVPNAEVHFLAGGTQTNMVMISYTLKDFECAIACNSGHINVHETGAVETSGHKVFTIPGKNGKVTVDDLEKALKTNTDEHMVKPGLVYISNSTEIGTIYQKEELYAISEFCHKHSLYLYMDGARLGSALTSKSNDLTPEDIGKCVDAFYVGGTKNGLMFGEALVIINKDLQKNFRYQIKTRGAMLAKGFVPGIMFEEAFKDGLYFELASHANEMADKIKFALKLMGYNLLESPTNQIFVTLDRPSGEKIIKRFGCNLWEDNGENLTIRIVTSFCTTDHDVNELIEAFKM